MEVETTLIQVEHIIQQLDVITKTELPAIVKARRGLDQLVLELDTAKAARLVAEAPLYESTTISTAQVGSRCFLAERPVDGGAPLTSQSQT